MPTPSLFSLTAPHSEVATINGQSGSVRPQLDWLTLTPTAPPSRTLHQYQSMQRWPWGRWRFMRTARLRIPMLATLQAQLQELRVGLCRAAMHAHRRLRTIEGAIDPIAIGALAQVSASMVIEVSVPAGHRWTARGLTLEHLPAAGAHDTGADETGADNAEADDTAVALARLDKVDWSQTGLVGVPVTVSDGEGKEIARAVVSFAVTARSD